MERRGPDRVGRRAASASTDDGWALRDASEILERDEADEADAAHARRRFRIAAMQPITADAAISHHLERDEVVLAVRRSVVVDRREPDAVSSQPDCLAGDLYVTSRRLLIVGSTMLTFDLAAIEEATVSAARLLLIMEDGAGLAFDVDRPRLLRVEISAARAALRA